MQSASSRIWTRVTVSISYDDNHYTTGTSTKPQAPSIAFRLVLRTTSRVCTELLWVGSCWTSTICSSVWRSPQEKVTQFFSSVPHVFFLIRIVLEMGSWWTCNCCFVRCYFQDLFSMARSILVHLPSSLFSMPLVNIYVVHQYISIDMAAARKNAF